MATAIGVDHRPISGFCHRLYGSIMFTSSASGLVPMVQLTTMQSKQSMMGERYTLPAGIWNSVMSVNHF